MECSRSDVEPVVSLSFESVWQFLHCTLKSLETLWKEVWLLCWRSHMVGKKPWDHPEAETGQSLLAFSLSSTSQPSSLGCQTWEWAILDILASGAPRWPQTQLTLQEQRNYPAEPGQPTKLRGIKIFCCCSNPLNFVIVCYITIAKRDGIIKMI